MNTEDVLEKYTLEIEGARLLVAGLQKLPSMQCIVDLAAALRAEREKLIEIVGIGFRNAAKIETLAKQVLEWKSRYELQHEYALLMGSTVDELRERVAELEAARKGA